MNPVVAPVSNEQAADLADRRAHGDIIPMMLVRLDARNAYEGRDQMGGQADLPAIAVLQRRCRGRQILCRGWRL